MKRKILSFLAAGMLFTLPAAAQSVGVVMSGGGAKGLYHIGVLQALEESGIPIDYVSGTSMGSIIAGMYAAGYSPEEMRRIVASGASTPATCPTTAAIPAHRSSSRSAST